MAKLPPMPAAYRLIVNSLRVVIGALQLRFTVTGTENLRPEPRRFGLRIVEPGRGALLAINHFSYVDFVFAGLAVHYPTRAWPRYMITRKRASNWFVSAVCDVCDHIVVDRAHGEVAYEEAAMKLRRGDYVAIFPEGSTNRSLVVRKPRYGTVRLAAETGVPIIPIGVFGQQRLWTKGRRPSLREAWRVPVRVHIGKLLYVSPDEPVEEANTRLFEAMTEAVDFARNTYPEPLPEGAWWVPAHLGGSAMTVDEDLARYREDASRYNETG